MRLNFLKAVPMFESFFFFSGCRFSRLGEGEGEATGDGDASGVGVALGLATAAASGAERRDLTAMMANASTSTTAIAAAIIISCLVDRFEKETDSREKERLFDWAGDCTTPAAAITGGLTTVTSVASLLAARLSLSFEISITRRPDGDSMPALRSASMFGELVIDACSSPRRSAVVSNSWRNTAAFAGRSCGRFSSACKITSSKAAGIDATNSRGRRGNSDVCFIAIASGVEPLK